jgi:peptidoglycan/xylan/chitin deacetylase (PgdA/CDA1 family)
MYHRLGPGLLPGGERDPFAVNPNEFEAHLDLIEEAGLPVLPFEAIAAAATEGRPLPAKGVALTFDDGYATDHAVALPALARRGQRAAFFVTPAWVGTPGHLTWSEVKELLRAGMTVGAHGFDHALLSFLPEPEIVRQLKDARRVLTDHLGRSPEALSLPGGASSPVVLAAARAEGFRVVLGSLPQPFGPGRSFEAVPRFAVKGGTSSRSFRALVEQKPAAILGVWARHHLLWRFRAVIGESLFWKLRDGWLGKRRAA